MRFLLEKFNILKGVCSPSHHLQQHNSFVLKSSFKNMRFTKLITDSNGNVKNLGVSVKHTGEVIDILKGYSGHSIVICVQRVDLSSKEKLANLADLYTGSFESTDVSTVGGSLTSVQKVPLSPTILNSLGKPRLGNGRQIHVDSYNEGTFSTGGNIINPADKNRQQYFFTNDGVKITFSLQEVKDNIVVLSSSPSFNKAFEDSMKRPVFDCNHNIVGCVSDQIFDEMSKGTIHYISEGAQNSISSF